MDSNTYEKAIETFKQLKDNVNPKSVCSCLSVLLIITREKKNLASVYDTTNLKTLVLLSRTEIIALQCLNNIVLKYPSARIQLIEPFIDCCVDVLSLTKTIFDRNHSLLYYNLRIAFLLSALCPDQRQTISDKLCPTLINFISQLLEKHQSKDDEIIAEALKVSYNLTMNNVIQVPQFAQIINKSINVEKLSIHAINLLNNMPPEIYEDITNDTADIMIDELALRIDPMAPANIKESLLPVMHCCTNACKSSERIRQHWFKKIISSTTEFDLRPEQYNTIRGNLVKLMTHVDLHIKTIAAEFLFTLCDEDVEKFVTYVGVGNAAHFLTQRGLFGALGKTPSSSISEPSNDAYEQIKSKIDPMTGKIETKHDNNSSKQMSDAEKEEQALELVKAIKRLSELGVVKPAKIDSEGQIRELDPENE